jgi:hypothetical protein
VIRWILQRLVDLLIHRAMWTPYHHLDGYMERWWLFGGSDPARDERAPRERGWRGSKLDAWVGRFLACRIHNVLRSDNDRHMHDHRWASLSIVLRGGYYEVTPRDQAQHPRDDRREFERRWRGPGSVIFRRHSTSRHRLDVPEGKTCWTLFLMIGKPQDWGFYTEHGRVVASRHDEYKAATTERERHSIAWECDPVRAGIVLDRAA